FFVQSRLPEHAELHLLFSMVTPLGWLERVPTYKEQLENMKDRDINTYGFLGYPLLQAADILMYKANAVPVGEDQVPHVELTREVARRFNLAFGGFEMTPQGVQRLGRQGRPLEALGKLSLDAKPALVNDGIMCVHGIFPEPESLLTSSPRL